MAYIVKQGGRNKQVAIYLAENVYDPKKRGARQRRKYLGVFDESNSELLLGRNSDEPDKTTLELLEKKGIKYLGGKADPTGRKPRRSGKRNFPLATNSANGVATLRIVESGRPRALTGLAERSGLTRSLTTAFGEKDARRLLLLALHQVCEGEPVYLAEPWLAETEITDPSGLSSSSLNRLVEKVGGDEDARSTFLRSWIEENGNPAALIHDTTSISTYARDLIDAEWGYNRDKEKLPQINLAMVVARDGGLPLWYRIVAGSVPDVRTLSLTRLLLEHHGLRDADFSLDRGYFSNDNVRDLLESEADFTIGVPFTNTQSRQIAHENSNALKTVRRSFLHSGERLRHIACEYQVKGGDDRAAKLPAHLYFNPTRREESLKRLETTILQLEVKAERRTFKTGQEAKQWIWDNAGAVAKLLTVSTRKGVSRVTRKSNALTKAARHFGMTLILTSKPEATREQVLSEYRCRDAVEKLFDVYKNTTCNKRLRASTEGGVAGRVFLAFLSVTLHSLLASRLGQSEIGKACSTKEALAMLRKIKMIRTSSGEEHMNEIPKKARQVLSALGLGDLYGGTLACVSKK